MRIAKVLVAKQCSREPRQITAQRAQTSICVRESTTKMWQVRAAGLLGGSSVAAGAYGAHGLKVSEEYKTIWRTAVQYHQFAAVSLLAAAAVPSARARMVSGAGICLGAAAFSGSNYAVAFYQDRSLAKLGPYGGMSLIGGWLALTVL